MPSISKITAGFAPLVPTQAVGVTKLGGLESPMVLSEDAKVVLEDMIGDEICMAV